MQRLRILVSQSNNPWFNLATEEWIFGEMDPTVQTLFLWQNAETVVIGRNQNPWSECNLARMEADNVRLARRTTGGGAVFQDLGNTCFTFLSPKSGYSRQANIAIVLGALKSLGVVAEASGRNDLVVPFADGPRKISGSAFREARDRCFHHGTLLIHADLNRLALYLTPNPKKMESKGRASVRARVMNMAEINPALTHESICTALIREFTHYYTGDVADVSRAETAVEMLDPDQLAQLPLLREKFERLSSWDWRFGHAPQFQYQMSEHFTWGMVEVHFDANQGRIDDARIFSDALFPDVIDGFQKNLKAKEHSRLGVQKALTETLERHPECSLELNQLAGWLQEQVEI